jgi:hypothetical protein
LSFVANIASPPLSDPVGDVGPQAVEYDQRAHAREMKRGWRKDEDGLVIIAKGPTGAATVCTLMTARFASQSNALIARVERGF